MIRHHRPSLFLAASAAVLVLCAPLASAQTTAQKPAATAPAWGPGPIVTPFPRNVWPQTFSDVAPDPAILVADEPTGNLDEATGKQIVDLLFTKHAERGMTLVLVTHDASLAHRCDRVVRLRSGRIDTQAAERNAAS